MIGSLREKEYKQLAIKVNEAVNAINEAIKNDDQLRMYYDQGVDGLSFEVKNWSQLCPVLENLLDQSWFPDEDWVRELIAQSREEPLLKLSEDRINQLERVIEVVAERLPVVLEAWSVLVHPKSDEAFHIGVDTQDFPDLKDLAEELDSIFKLLAVDNSFSVTISEAFILVVPEGPYSHFCAVFALYLAKKTLELTEGSLGQNYKAVIRFLPEYQDENTDTEGAIEKAIQKWASTALNEDWEWFVSVRNEHFADQPSNARNNIEKALPLICKLLKKGNCYIDPPSNIPEVASSELKPRYEQLTRAMERVSRVLNAGEPVVRTALKVAERLIT